MNKQEGIKLNVFAFKDKMVGSWSKPIVTNETKDSYVKGSIRAAIRSQGNDRAYAKDQALYFLGTYDDGTGTFDLLKDAEKCCDLEDYVRDKK